MSHKFVVIMSLEAKRTLVYAILKFMKDELKEETISPDFKESLEGVNLKKKKLKFQKN